MICLQVGARSHRGLADVDTNDIDDANNDAVKKEAVKNVPEKVTKKVETGNK